MSRRREITIMSGRGGSGAPEMLWRERNKG